MSEPFLIYGHRGAPLSVPENTLASFEEALRNGADGFETDLRRLSDGTAVLHHDDELDGVEIETLASGEYVSRGLTPVHVFELGRFAGRCSMILEIKRSGWEDALITEVGQWPAIVVASFDHSLIAQLHRRGVPFALGITMFGVIVEVAEYAARIGASWCYPSHRFVSEAMVKSLHERGIRVVPWTANRQAEWERLRAIGCDGVITDFPAEAVAWRAGVAADAPASR